MADIDKQLLFPEGLSRPTGVWSTVTVARPGRLVFVPGLTAKNANGEPVGTNDIPVRGHYFDQDPPASTMVAVSAFTHPDILIEINAIAVLH